MPKLAVVDGAILRCVVGSVASPLIVTTDPNTEVNGARLATVRDNQPCINVMPFGTCQITGGHCGPVTSTPWLPGVSSTTPTKHPVLVEGSILPCSVGGVIQIQNPGQTFIYVDATFPPGFSNFVKTMVEAAKAKAALAAALRGVTAVVNALFGPATSNTGEDSGPGLLKRGGSLGIDLSPAGTVKGWIDAYTGKDAITGEHIGTLGRVVGAVPVAGKYVKRGAEGVTGLFGAIKGIFKGKPKPPPTPRPKPKPRPVTSHIPHGEAPPKAERVLKYLDEHGGPARAGSAPPGYRGGRSFENDGRHGSEVLPRTDAQGNPITYREWDVNPNVPRNRGDERLVTGSNGSAYYTDGHYRKGTVRRVR